MNTNRTATRLFSFALAAMITASMLAGIDTLAATRSRLPTACWRKRRIRPPEPL